MDLLQACGQNISFIVATAFTATIIMQKNVDTNELAIGKGTRIAQVMLFQGHDGNAPPRVLVNEFRLGSKIINRDGAFAASIANFPGARSVVDFMVTGIVPPLDSEGAFYPDSLNDDELYCDELDIRGSEDYPEILASYGSGTPGRVHITYAFCPLEKKEQLIEKILSEEIKHAAGTMVSHVQRWARLNNFETGREKPPIDIDVVVAERAALMLELMVGPEAQDLGHEAARKALFIIARDVMGGGIDPLKEIDLTIATLLQARTHVASLIEKGHKQALAVEAPEPSAPADDSPSPGR